MKYRIGLVCPPFTGHLNPTLSLALELQKRKYETILFYYTNRSINTVKLEELKIKTIFIGSEADEKLINNSLKILSGLSGSKANKQTMYIYGLLARMNLRCLPDKIEETKCEALLIDQSLFEGESIAYVTARPFVTICNALILNPDINLPPPFMEWQLNLSLFGKLRNLIGYAYVGLKYGETTKIVREYREQKNLPAYPSFFKGYFEKLWSSTAIISQQPVEFDFKRSSLKSTFHYTAPFIDPELRKQTNFPWNKLDRKPLIYASIGTLQHSVDNIYYKIARACVGVNCQLVMSLGKNNKGIRIDNLPTNAIVVNYAPQLELLEKASLCITHAGINTTLECLSYGVPMVAIPIANDQPGIAERIKWTGTGKVLNRRSKIFQLNQAIKEVLQNNIYRKNALKMQQSIQEINGVKVAADIIEKATASLCAPQ